MTVEGPDIHERGPHDGNFEPTKYFKCPILDSKVEKIEMSMKWKDQVIPQILGLYVKQKYQNCSVAVQKSKTLLFCQVFRYICRGGGA